MTNLQLKEILEDMDQSELFGGHANVYVNGHIDSATDFAGNPL